MVLAMSIRMGLTAQAFKTLRVGTPPSGGSMSNNSNRSLGQIFASITEDIASLVRGEIALAKAELKQSARMAARGAGLIAAAVFLANLSFIFLLIAFAFAIANASDNTWTGFLIVALLLIAITAVLGFFARRHFQQVKGPQRAQAQTEATLDTLRQVPDKFMDAFEQVIPENPSTKP